MNTYANNNTTNTKVNITPFDHTTIHIHNTINTTYNTSDTNDDNSIPGCWQHHQHQHHIKQ